jgi:hypothetical protein
MYINQRVRKVVFWCSGAIGFISLTFSGALTDKFVHYLRVPEQELDQVIPLSIKGITVYVTASESLEYSSLHWIAAVTFGVCVVIAFTHLKWPIR